MIRADGPASSFLLLAGGTRVSAEEILHAAAARVPGRSPGLVSLAACTTHRAGRAYDEAVTLSTAFLVAGAATAVGSLWPVPDRETARLMVAFHDNVARGRPPRTALREASWPCVTRPTTRRWPPGPASSTLDSRPPRPCAPWPASCRGAAHSCPSDVSMSDWTLRGDVHGDVVNGDKVNGDKVSGNKIVSPERRPRNEPTRPMRTEQTLLVLSANPGGTGRLQLDREHRQIVAGVAAAQGLGRLDVRIADAVRIEDLQPWLLNFTPVALHFAGHGQRGGIAVTGDDGRARLVPAAALAELVGIFAGELRCVFLNACYSDEQAEAIAEHGTCVVGMRGPVLDDTAIRFAEAFYTGAAAGRSVADAFALGRSRLALEQIDAHPPILFAGSGVARSTYLVGTGGAR